MIERGEGVRYFTTKGDALFDFASGLWCTNAGHCHPKIVEAVQKQAATLDYSMAFTLGHPTAFRLATRLTDFSDPLNKIFFTNSLGGRGLGPENRPGVASHARRCGRTHLIGREKGYHGAGFGGTSVAAWGTIVAFTPCSCLGWIICPTPTTSTTWPSPVASPNGAPTWTTLERRIDSLHGGESVAAVIVEPVAGSAGVIVPLVGYLQRLRELCTKHGILLIFDEVITGFGRLGENFASQRFDVVPDMICCAKGIISGMIPMGRC